MNLQETKPTVQFILSLSNGNLPSQEEDPFAAMDLSANILMVFGAVGALLSFLSVSDSTTTNPSVV